MQARIRSAFKMAIWLIAGLLSVGMARATVLTLDFEAIPEQGTNTSNLTMGGFVFSSRCHYHSMGPGAFGIPDSPTGKSLGFDNSGCYDGSATGYNHDYLGPDSGAPGQPNSPYPGAMYVARVDGQAFDLHSFIFTAQSDGGGYTLYSSNGGQLSADYSSDLYKTLAFSGPQWDKVTWLLFETLGGDHPVGFDNLTLAFIAVDEPGVLVLFAMALMLMVYARRRLPGPPAPVNL